MRFSAFNRLLANLAVLLLALLIVPSVTLNTRRGFFVGLPLSLQPPVQSSNLKILGPDKKPNPVVNERNQISLTVVDANGQPVTDLAFESGSPDVASVDSKSGMVMGVQQGFATITARRANGDNVSAFIAVARSGVGKGAKVMGDIKVDTGGRIYISDPIGNVILRKDSFAAPANPFAGKKGVNGKNDGSIQDALFAGPTAMTVDNSAQGGIYIADTLNHSVRKIDSQGMVKTILGNGSPGVNTNDVTPFAQAMFRGPRGIAADIGGNLFIADTENHAIYYADFTKQQMFLLAGQPGMSGKADGRGRVARFTRPTGIALSPDGGTIAVADTGNNLVRLITRNGDVTTLGAASSAGGVTVSKLRELDQTADEIVFDAPQSVSFDSASNVYVVDKSGVQVVTRPKEMPQVVSLAQPGTFGQAVSVVVKGTDAFVLDAGAASDDTAVNDVTVGAPEITSLSQPSDRLEGGAEIIITGKNFAPESQVVLGDSQVKDTDLLVESATRIRFHVPPQNAPGVRTLSVRTRGGVAQRSFSIIAKSLSELADGEITTVVGGVPFLGDGGIATSAILNFDNSSDRFRGGVVLDGAGNLFIVDSGNSRIRRVDTSGVITTVAGNGRKGFSGDDGLAVGASLNTPRGIALDKAGNLFVADRFNNRIRRVDAKTGIITTVAGNGTGDFTGDGGPAISAGLVPADVAVDGAGNLLVADISHNRIRQIDAATGIITTVVGSGPDFEGGFSGDGGLATSARLNEPVGVAVDSTGNIFITDLANERIRRVDASTRIITTVAGDGFRVENGDGRFSGDGGPATSASLNGPGAVAVDGAGNLFIGDTFNNRVRRVDAKTGIITTIAGNGSFDFGGDGGPATEAGLIDPEGVVVDGAGNLLIADLGNNRIRRVDAATGIITTFTGNGATTFSGDGGPAISARLSVPRGIALDGTGNLFIADEGNDRVRRVDAGTGIISTVAGNGIFDFNGDGGPATEASLYNPLSVAVDRAGNLFIADRDNNRIRRVDLNSGVITTVAGNGMQNFGGDGDPATGASLDSPVGVALDIMGNIFIADLNNQRVRRVDIATGIITTVAGNGTADFSGDGGPATSAGLNNPVDVAVDRASNLFILDIINFRIRRVDRATGIITTVAGNGSSDFSGDGGPATSASLNFFSGGGIAVDRAGNLFIADNGNHRIRRVDAKTGIITTVAGNGTAGFSGDDGPATDANLDLPEKVAIDGAGNLFIADTGNNVIRVVKGIAVGQSAVTITGASFAKGNLIINGTGFGSSGARVSVNGRDVSSLIVNQTDTTITLKGNKKKLGLKKGANQIMITVGGATSTFTLNL